MSSVRWLAGMPGLIAMLISSLTFEPVTSSWFPAGLVHDLEGLLGRRVEVVTERGLNHLIRDEILREAVPI